MTEPQWSAEKQAVVEAAKAWHLIWFEQGSHKAPCKELFAAVRALEASERRSRFGWEKEPEWAIVDRLTGNRWTQINSSLIDLLNSLAVQGG